MADSNPRDLRNALDRRFATLKTERTEWEHEWTLVQKYVAPKRGRREATDKYRGRSAHKNIVNNVAARAVRTCANGLAANIINPSTAWFRLAPEDDELAEYGKVREWLGMVEWRVYQILGVGGFYGAATTALTELVAFGTCALAEEVNFDTVRRWHPFTAWEYYAANGADGKATTVYREWSMTTEQLIGNFGPERCSRAVRMAWETGNLDAKFKIRHAIEPYSDRFASRPGLSRWKYVSAYYDPADDERERFLRMGGNSFCPVHVARWDHVPPDAYGSGPVADCLGDVAGLQLIERDMVVGIGHKTNPAMQGPATQVNGGAMNPLRFERGSYNPVNGLQEIRPLIDPRSFMLTDAEAYIERLEQRIARTLYNDLFLAFLSSDRREMTATEVIERAREKLQIGPVLHNINAEMLSPVINSVVQTIFDESRDFWARGEPGMVPVPPQEIQDADLRIEYVSDLQQSQRLTRAEPIYRLAAFVGEFAAIDPTLPMKIDFHQCADELGAALGVPPKTVRDDETVAAMIAEQRAAQQQAEQQQQQLAQAETIQKLGNASTEPGTALGDLAAETA